MKVLQLNIWGGKLGKQIVELLNREQADVVCLQEVVDFPGGETFLVEELNEIKQQTDYEFVFYSPQFSFNLMNRQAKMGLAILSKLPFLETNHQFTHLEYVDNYDFLEIDDYNIRGLQHVLLEQNNQKLHILNHHGHHISKHKNGDDETMRQCGMIVDYIKKLEGPVVLCGDFNLSPESESLEMINNVLLNHAKEKGITTTRTSLTHKTEVCDYIFTSSDIEIKDFQVLDDIASDHKALTVEI